MPRILIRLVSVLLIPCLGVEPATAAALRNARQAISIEVVNVNRQNKGDSSGVIASPPDVRRAWRWMVNGSVSSQQAGARGMKG